MTRIYIRCPECGSRDIWQKFTCSLPVNDEIDGKPINWSEELWMTWSEGEYGSECTCGDCGHKFTSEFVARGKE
jgi:hypothetical protein|tara:strand:+ start:783 stop:1004 length:222 start_codon:yes stop_codon:yes gene_type:complete